MTRVEAERMFAAGVCFLNDGRPEAAEAAFRQAGRPRVVLRFREEFSAQNRALFARCVEEGFDCAYYRGTEDLWRWLQSVQEDDALWQ